MIHNTSKYDLPASNIKKEDWFICALNNLRFDIEWRMSLGKTLDQALQETTSTAGPKVIAALRAELSE